VDYLVQSLKSGHSEVLTQYLSAMARFHTYICHYVRTYAFRNIFRADYGRPIGSNTPFGGGDWPWRSSESSFRVIWSISSGVTIGVAVLASAL